ncbi:MAG: VCBS repeat-containing protein [Caldilineaceae bacterium]
MTIGDVTSDGRDDLVVTAGGNMPNAYLNVFVQGTTGLTTTVTTYAAFHLPSAVAVADINHDGREDVVVVHDGWRSLNVLHTQTVDFKLAPYASMDRALQQSLPSQRYDLS